MKYRERIGDTLATEMERDPRMLILGEGVTDPKHIFETTALAHKRFPDRVIETPLSENMITGACVGMAAEGWNPVLVHARAEFSLVSFEHLINTAAKWPWLHGDEDFRMTVRMLVGRGWGQGPTHSQSFHGMFAQVPGIKVYYPVNPLQVGTFLQRAVRQPGLTVFIEPRRVYDLDDIRYSLTSLRWGMKIGSCGMIGEASDPNSEVDLAIFTIGDVLLDALEAQKALREMGVLSAVFPWQSMVFEEEPPTRIICPALVCDTAPAHGLASYVARRAYESGVPKVEMVCPPFEPLGTAHEEAWYPSVEEIVKAACNVTNYTGVYHEVPKVAADTKFRGPF